MGNMDIYNAVSAVPGSAQKRITGGRVNGMTDINPMWRIRELTELFGPCGIGWKYKIVREWLETASTGAGGGGFLGTSSYNIGSRRMRTGRSLFLARADQSLWRRKRVIICVHPMSATKWRSQMRSP